jgi:hypothetical protein
VGSDRVQTVRRFFELLSEALEAGGAPAEEAYEGFAEEIEYEAVANYPGAGDSPA